MNKKLVVVFNGPPGCGKDDAANYLHNAWVTSSRRQFKDKLFELTAAIYGVSQQDLQVTWYTRELKEQPREELKGLSPRQALIKVSERVIKPSLGHLYFGEALADSLDDGITFVSDSGFTDELLPVIDLVGGENVLVIRIFGRGSFEGDSRDYLPASFLNALGVKHFDIDNTSSLSDYLTKVESIVDCWTSGEL